MLVLARLEALGALCVPASSAATRSGSARARAGGAASLPAARRAGQRRRSSSSASAGQAQELAAAAARPASWLAAAHGPGAAHERAGSPPAPRPAQEGQTQLAAAGWAKRLKPAQGAAPAATSTVAQ